MFDWWVRFLRESLGTGFPTNALALEPFLQLLTYRDRAQERWLQVPGLYSIMGDQPSRPPVGLRAHGTPLKSRCHVASRGTDPREPDCAVITERVLYESSNGDTWFLARNPVSKMPVVKHQPNVSFGGQISYKGIGHFLRGGDGIEPAPLGPQVLTWPSASTGDEAHREEDRWLA
jgi:hypothetical protein